MAAIITEKFRQHNATQFFESFTEASASTYYLFVGKATAYTSELQGVVILHHQHQVIVLVTQNFMHGIPC